MSKITPKLPDWVQQLNASKKLSNLTADQQERLDKARLYAKEISPTLKQRKPQIKAEQMQMMAAEQSSFWIDNIAILCRVYVGSINYDVVEAHLRALFAPFGWINSVCLSYDPMQTRHKGFSFIEFDTPEASTTALLEMDGHMLGGRNIKVGRTQQYPAEGNRVLPSAPKSRIYISNIHDLVAESDIMEIFAAYGDIKAMSMPHLNDGKHKTYALIEFENVGSANAAMQAMNGFELGGQKLHVSKAIYGCSLPLLSSNRQ